MKKELKKNFKSIQNQKVVNVKKQSKWKSGQNEYVVKTKKQSKWKKYLKKLKKQSKWKSSQSETTVKVKASQSLCSHWVFLHAESCEKGSALNCCIALLH